MAVLRLTESLISHPLRLATSSRGLVLDGACDLASIERLSAALEWHERRRAPFDVDHSQVTFADTTGLALLADSVRRCRRAGLAQPRPTDASAAVHRVLDALGVSTDPFDLAAWDAADLEVVANSSTIRTGGGDRRRPRGTGSITPVTSLVRATEHDAGSATMRRADA